MIRIDLHNDYYLREQIPQLTKDLKDIGYDVTESTVRKLVEGDIFVTDAVDLKKLKRKPSVDDIIMNPIDSLPTDTDGFIGAAAVRHMFEIMGSDSEVIPFSTININPDVFNECSRRIWYDISYSAAALERRVARFDKLIQSGIPVIINMCEYRCVWDLIDRLNDNNGDNAIVKPDGTAIRSLSDIGYSLVFGWNEDMQSYFAEQEERLEKELDAIVRDESDDGSDEEENEDD